MKDYAPLLVLAFAGFTCSFSHAGLFEDDEARKAILELRQKVEALRTDADARLNSRLTEEARKNSEDNAQVRRSLLEMQNQLEVLRSDLANLRGVNERLTKDVSELQRRQKDADQELEDRLRKLEPVKVTVDGREFTADPGEQRDFDNALALFRQGEFPAAQTAFVSFVRRYSRSGYAPAALFWLGNAQYATRDYKEAIINFQQVIAIAPDHLRAPEAALSMANCQIELKDTKSAKKTLGDLIKAYPQSEAAVTAKDRLARLK